MTNILRNIHQRPLFILTAMYLANLGYVGLGIAIAYRLIPHWPAILIAAVLTYWLVGYVEDAQGSFSSSVPWTWRLNARRAWCWPRLVYQDIFAG